MIILLTGGSGRLGREIQRIDRTVIAPSHDEMNIMDVEAVSSVLKEYQPDIVIHLAAATTPPEHEKNPTLGLTVNVIGTAQVALACLRQGCKLVYTSSDYVYTGPGPHRELEPVLPPNNFYWSKLGGEAAVRLCPNSLVLRLSFGSRPFPYPQVYADQWCSKLYVDEMAPLVLAAAQSAATGILNLGGPRVMLEAYARRSQPDITIIPKPDWVPADVSLDLTNMQELLGIKNLTDVLKS